jgi:glutamyl-tRNA reductase
LLIDIAVPRDIDPAVRALPGVHLFDVDDLNGIVNKNLAARLVEAEKIEIKIDEAIQEFQTWLITLGVVPIMNELRARALTVQEETMESLERKLDHLSDRDKKVIGKHMKSIINQMLREPIDYIKDAAAQPDANTRINQFVETFGLDVDVPDVEPEMEETEAMSAKAPLRALMR